MTWFWILIFVVSMAVMLKGADWFLKNSERLGLRLGLSPFIIGVTILALGTSLPELVSALFAVGKDASDVVAGNAVGSNIANIFLVIGTASLLGKTLKINKDLINLDLPLLATSTAVFFFLALDRVVTLPEAILLLVAHVIYFLYSILYKKEDSSMVEDMLPEQKKKERKAIEPLVQEERPSFTFKNGVLLVIGAAGLIAGAQYMVESVVTLAEIWSIASGVIAATAVAFGTSLPELIVSGMAALKGKAETAIGNIFGSNVFNLLAVVGVPALITDINLDQTTYTIGLPFLAVATLLFIFTGISRRIHFWEGGFFLLLYIIFVAKLVGLL